MASQLDLARAKARARARARARAAAQTTTPTWGDTAITTGLRIVPSVAGSALGGVVGAAAGGVGAVPGLALGGGAGAGLGEWLAQGYEQSRGLRDDISPLEILTETGLGAIPLGRTLTVPRAIRQGALMGGGGEVARGVINEGEFPDLERILMGTALGGAFGGATDVATRVVPGALRARSTQLEDAVAAAQLDAANAPAVAEGPTAVPPTRRQPSLQDTSAQVPPAQTYEGRMVPDPVVTPQPAFTSPLDRVDQPTLVPGTVSMKRAIEGNEQRKAAIRQRLRDRVEARRQNEAGLFGAREQYDELARTLGLPPLTTDAVLPPPPRAVPLESQGTLLPTPQQYPQPGRQRPVANLDDTPLPPPEPGVPPLDMSQPAPVVQAPRKQPQLRVVPPAEPVQPAPPPVAESAPTPAIEAPAAAQAPPADAAGYATIPATDIKVDPQAYQFKSDTDARGRNVTLKGVEAWSEQAGRMSPITVHRRLDGSVYVVDGHQRVGLAQDLIARGKPVPPLNAIVLDEAEGITVEQARRIGNMGNVIAGTADPFDIAKVLRVADLDAKEAEWLGKVQSDTGAKYRQGRALAELGDQSFEYIRRENVPSQFAQYVPRYFKSDAEQLAALETIRRVGFRNQAEADSYLSKMASAGFSDDGAQADLFGNVQVNPLIEKVVKLESDVIAELGRAKSAFGAAVRNAKMLEGEGQTVIDRDAAGRAADQAAKARFLVRKYANQKGTNTNEALREAVQLAEAGRLTPGQAADLVIEAVERDWNNLPVRPGAGPGVRPVSEQPTPLPGAGGGPDLFNEGGIIAPRLASTLAGGALGGTVGGIAPADSPEERTRNVIAGAAAGLAGGAAVTAAVTRRPKAPPLPPQVPTSATPPPGPVQMASGRRVRGALTRETGARGERVATIKPGEYDLLPPEKRIRASRVMSAPLAKMPEGARSAIVDTMVRNGGFQEQRRNVRPQRLSVEVGKRMAVELEQVLPPGTALNSEQMSAYAMATANAATRVTDTAKRIAGLKAKGIARDVDLLELAQATADLNVLMQSFRGASAESGRALNIQKVVNRTLPSEWRILVAGKNGKQLREDGERIAQLFAEVKDPVEAMKIARAEQAWKRGEALQSYWMANILSGLQTQQRNILGNAFNLATRSAMKTAAGGYDALLSTINPGREREVFAGESVQNAIGIFGALDKATADAWQTLRDGFSERQLDEMLSDLRSIDLGRKEFRGGALNPFNMVGRALDAADRFFFTLNQNAELYGQSYSLARKALAKRGVTPTSKGYQDALAKEMVQQRMTMPQERRQQILQSALQGVYREKPGKLTQALMSLKSQYPSAGYVIPFVRTVGNLLRQGYEFTPLSLGVKGTRRALGNREAFGATERERVLTTTRGLLGAMASFPLAVLASQGRLSGAGPADRAEKEQLRASGWMPNSIKVPLSDEVAAMLGAQRSDDGEYWINYNTFEPLALPMSLIANSFEAWRDLDRKRQSATTEQDTFALFAQTMGRVAQSGLDRSYFTGIASLVDAFQNPERGMTRAIIDLARGFMPLSGLSRNIQRAADPTLRDPQGFVEEMLSSVPIASQQLPARIGRYGQDQERQGSALRRGFSVPEIQGTVSDPIDDELTRLEVFIGVPSERVSVTGRDGRPAKQTREFIEEVRRGRGELARQAVAGVINSPTYQRLDDFERKRLLERQISAASRRASAAARAATLSGKPDIFRRATEPLRRRGRQTLQ